MKKQRLAKTLVSICLVLVLAFMLPAMSLGAPAKSAPAPGSAQQSAWQPPASISIGATGVATTGYPTAVGMTSKIGEATKVKFSVIPAQRTMERAMILRKGEAPFQFETAIGTLFALKGTAEYKDLGPQSYRAAWVGGVLIQGLATRASANIRKWSDLKGKKVASYPYHAAPQHHVDASLAYGNIGANDVIAVPMSGYPAGAKALLAGSVDAASLAAESAPAKELAASVQGVYWMPLPNITPEDKAAWARFQNILPGFFPVRTPRAAGASKDKPVDIWGYYYHVIAFDDTDKNLVYWFTKQINENYPAFKTVSAYLSTWTLEECLKPEAWFAPWHEGSIQYFKDIGRWTPEMEAKQQTMLATHPQKMTRLK